MKSFNSILILLTLLLLVSCEKDKNNSAGNNNLPDKAAFSVKMVDSPGSYDAVNIDVLSLKANYNGQWVEFPLESPGIFNLLDFTNGNSLILIGDTALLPGTITEIRLLLGESNTVVVDGISHDLQTPSGQSSGYKVKMEPQALEAGRTYVMVIDFDVNRSIHQTGNGKYMLKPVVQGFLENAVGQIEGVVMPPYGALYVQAYNLTDTVGTIIDTVSGQFLITTVMPGTFNVVFLANAGFQDTTVTGVPVVAGQITLMDTVFISGLSSR
jgi:hypothetical protein